jgi:hypothetical protein
MREQSELYKQLGKPLKDTEPNDFFKCFVRYICVPKESIKEDKKKPETPILTSNDTDSLTSEDLEEIAKKYVLDNQYLYGYKEREKIKKIDLPNIKYECLKAEDESYVDYLYRLTILEEEKTQETFKKLADSFSGIGNFSSELEKNIKSTLFLGDSLSKELEAFKTPSESTYIQPFESRFSNIDVGEIARRSEESRLEPFNKLSERLDSLIESSIKTSEFLIKANKIQTEIASEIKSSSDTTTFFSKWNIALSLLVTTIAGLSLALTVYTIISSNHSDLNYQTKLQHNTTAIVEKLSDVNTNFTEQQKTGQQLISRLIDATEISISQQSSLFRSLQKNSEKYQELQDKVNQQKAQIIDLNKMILQLKGNEIKQLSENN